MGLSPISDREFNPSLLLDWVGEVIYGLVTVIHSQRIALPLIIKEDRFAHRRNRLLEYHCLQIFGDVIYRIFEPIIPTNTARPSALRK